MTTCSILGGYQRFRGACYRHPQGWTKYSDIGYKANSHSDPWEKRRTYSRTIEIVEGNYKSKVQLLPGPIYLFHKKDMGLCAYLTVSWPRCPQSEHPLPWKAKNLYGWISANHNHEKKCYPPSTALLMVLWISGGKFPSEGVSMMWACCLAAISAAPRLLERLRLERGVDIGKWMDLSPVTVWTSACSIISVLCACNQEKIS